MKRQITLLLPAFMISIGVSTVHADHHLKLSGELKPLEFLIGDWLLEWESDDGVQNKITLSTKPDAQGHVLRTSGQWRRDGDTLASWFSLRFDKGQSGGLTTINVVSNGSRNQGSTTIHEGTVVTKSKGINRNGDKVSFETHVKMVDENTISSQRLNIVVNGEARNDWPVGNYKRVK